MPNSWVQVDQAKDYLARADRLPHRGEGEGVLVRDLAGALPGRVLDLGCGDGRLTALVLSEYPASVALCIDMSPPMLDAATARFAADPSTETSLDPYVGQLLDCCAACSALASATFRGSVPSGGERPLLRLRRSVASCAQIA